MDRNLPDPSPDSHGVFDVRLPLELPLAGWGGVLTRESAPTGAIVAVGDELLSGQTLDTNSTFLSAGLAHLGVGVTHRYTVADREADIMAAVGRALEVADVVLVSGGLGPTPDDRTRDAVARLLDRPLSVDPDLLAALEALFRARGYEELPPTNRAQASVPRGGLVLGNPVGTAPCLALETKGRVVLLFPGVPRELERIFPDLAAPYLRGFLGDRLAPLRHREIHTTGLPESELAHRLAPVFAAQGDPVDVAYLPHIAGVTLRLTTRLGGHGADNALDRVESAVLPLLSGVRFEASSGDLVEAVASALLARRRTVATAESCTGGLIAKRLTDLPGASAWFLGGAVTYSDAAKSEVLGVDAGLIDADGAVSEGVAEAMALGAVGRFGSDCGIGVTGVAGPGGGTEAKPVGTVWYAVALGERITSRLERFTGDREAIRARAVQASLALLLNRLEASDD